MIEITPGGETNFVITGQRVRYFMEKDPTNIPWKDLDVDVVIECTGVFTKYTDAKAHINAGAKKVVISAPAKGEEGVEGKTLVFGTKAVDQYSGQDVIFSNASCTTNCISPVLQVLESEFGIEKAMMSTVHAYTASQGLVDGPNKKDIREGRAGAINIIPAATGAASAIGAVIPQLKPVFDGMALRVPVPDGSIADITAVLKTDVTVEEVQQAFIDAAETPFYKDILVTSNEPLVSSDIIGNPASSIVDLDFIRVSGGNMIKVLAWYDNEWGYTNRLVEMAVHVARFNR
jgi:glyceraldehyde 3-phosphate dehydrogenase